MGSGMSSDDSYIASQERYVSQNLQKAKNNMSNGHRYNDHQIEMKLRQEFNRTGKKDDYVLDRDWRGNY